MTQNAEGDIIELGPELTRRLEEAAERHNLSPQEMFDRLLRLATDALEAGELSLDIDPDSGELVATWADPSG